MQITKSILTNSDCYRAGRKITVKGLMIHSIGTPQPDPMVFVRNWNKPGVKACVHAFIGLNGVVHQTLPWNHRGWHGGGASNNTHIGVEMTEPKTIKYIGGSAYTNLDRANTRAHVMSTYKTAVELFAYLCKEYNLDPLTQIISHAEGYRLGIASNHGDPEHLWREHGLTMNGFRADVKAAMQPVAPTPAPVVEYAPAYINQKGENVRTLQKNLVKLGLLKAEDVDGSYGPRTTAAVKTFQTTHKLKDDGQAGPITQAKLKEVITILETPKPTPTPVAPIGTKMSGRAKVIYKGTDGLNVRIAPDYKKESIHGVVKFGEVFTITEKVGDFYKLASGLYISNNPKFVEYIAPVVASKEFLVRINTSVLNIRQSSSTLSRVVGTVRKGQVFTITEEKNGWGKLKSGAGWISLKYTLKL